MPTAKINGINIYYESHGDGFPLVLAYGIGGNTTEWEPQIPVLSQRYRLIVWDPRGHAQTDSPAGADRYTQEIFAEDLKKHGGLMKMPPMEELIFLEAEAEKYYDRSKVLSTQWPPMRLPTHEHE